MLITCYDPAKHIEKGGKILRTKKKSSYPGFRYIKSLIHTCVQIGLGLLAAVDAVGALGAVLSLSQGCQRCRALSFQPLLHDTRKSAGYSQAPASPAGSGTRQNHMEERQRDRRGFRIINRPSKAFQRMVSESPL